MAVLPGQLDAMETDKRPWIRADVGVIKPVIFTDWYGSRGINVPLTFELKNYGAFPATNIQISPAIAKHPGNPRRRELDAPQQTACDSARSRADENTIGGVAIFPGETRPDEMYVGASGLYQTDDAILFSVYGCIDYTYSNKRHGQTGFRMVLGRAVEGQIHGLPFVEGVERPYAHPIAPELLAQGYPKTPPKEALMQPGDFIFRPDDGGNYAK